MSRQYTRVLLGGESGPVILNVDGEILDTFDPSANSSLESIALQSDGKILLGGSFTSVAGTTRERIARVHANGALDTTFNPNANNSVRSIVQQSDGKILLGGSFTSLAGTTRERIARVHANGALDTTFNTSANSDVMSVALQSDGKILLGGFFTSVSATTRNRIARVHANGALDTTFNTSASFVVRSIAQQSDGKILLGGSFTSVAGTARNSIARVHANGALDTTFNPSAQAFSDVESIVQQSDGKILLGGNFTSLAGTTRNSIARVHANGALDTTFNPSAQAFSYVNSIALQSDGKILLGGSFTSVSGTTRNRIARVHENGALDTTFDPSASSVVRSIALQSDGKILLGGDFTSVAGKTRNRIARIKFNEGIIHTSNTNSNASDELYISVYSEEAKDVDFYFPYFDENNNSKITVSIDPAADPVDVATGITISGNDVDGAQVKAFTSSGEATITGYVNRLE